MKMVVSGLTQRKKRWGRAVAPTFAGALVLVASFLNFITSNDYPVIRPEVGVSITILVCLALLVGAYYGATGKFGKAILELTLLFIAIDLNFDGYIVLLIFVPLILLVWFRKLALFLSMVSISIIFGNLFQMFLTNTSGENYSSMITAEGKPVLLHVILDEHIGLDGILGTEPRANEFRNKMKDFYLEKGFQIFSGAYSKYLHTINSIPEIINYGDEKKLQKEPYKGMEVLNNRYFDDLGEKGYRIRVFQTFFLKYCRNEFVDSCITVSAFDPHNLNSNRISTLDKSFLMLVEFAKLSRLVEAEAKVVDILAAILRRVGISIPSPELANKHLPRAAGAVQTLEQLRPLLAGAGDGEAFFVHVLFPHYPYVMDSECRIKPVAAWVNRRSPLTIEQRYEAYFEQLDCVLLQLGKIFDALPEDAIIIINGDHGSRITTLEPIVENKGRFSDEDLIAGYSTLFAVRSKDLPGRLERGRFLVSRLLKELVDSDFQSIKPNSEADLTPSIILENRGWQPKEQYHLPAWWVEGAFPESD